MDSSILTSPDTTIKPEDDDKSFKEYQYSASDLTPFTAHFN